MPEGRFPTGIVVPIGVVLAALVVVAGVCIVGLDAPGARQVPTSAVQAQQAQTRWVGDTVTRGLEGIENDLEADTASLIDRRGVGPAEVVRALGRPWRGVVVFDRADGRVLAGRGERFAVPGVGFGTDAVVQVVGGPDAPRVVATRPLGTANQGWVVAASQPLAALPGAADGASLAYLAGTDGRLLTGSGPAPAELDPATRGAVEQGAAAGGRGETGTAGTDPAAGDGSATVVAYAPVEAGGMSRAPGLAVVTVSSGSTTSADTERGVVAGLALLLIALAAAGTVTALLVVPIRRLRRAALGVAAGDLEQPVPDARVRELQVLGTVLRRSRDALRDRGEEAPVEPSRRSVPALALVCTVALALVAWSAALWWVGDGDGRELPAGAPTAARDQNRAAAQTLSSSLIRSVADVEAVAARPEQLAVGWQPVLADLAARQPRYRSVSVVDPGGTPVVSAGRTPLRDRAPTPSGSGLVQANTSGSLPIVFAHAALPRPGWAVIAELDIGQLSDQLDLPLGQGRVVDEGMRTVLASGGFQAFSPLDDPILRSSVERARQDRPSSAVGDVSGAPALVSADAVAAGDLRWTVVTARPTVELDLAASPADRYTELAALVVLFLALALAGSHHLLLIRPLRRLTGQARDLAGGDVHVVIYPVRPDEIGTVASCFELVRQALVDGVHRLGPRRGAVPVAVDRAKHRRDPAPLPFAVPPSPARHSAEDDRRVDDDRAGAGARSALITLVRRGD